MVEQTKAEKIRQRRAQMLVHSYFYYIEDDPIIDDDLWQKWANELIDLGYLKINYYDKEFKNWDGSSGAYLPLNDPYVIGLSKYIKLLFTSNDENDKEITGLEEFM